MTYLTGLRPPSNLYDKQSRRKLFALTEALQGAFDTWHVRIELQAVCDWKARDSIFKFTVYATSDCCTCVSQQEL